MYYRTLPERFEAYLAYLGRIARIPRKASAAK
jgi:hypothetical protein